MEEKARPSFQTISTSLVGRKHSEKVIKKKDEYLLKLYNINLSLIEAMQREKTIFWTEKEAKLKMGSNFQMKMRAMKPLIVYYLGTERFRAQKRQL